MHMAAAVSGIPPVSTRPTILERLKVPPQLAWGYLGLLQFMIGDGIEAGYLAPFLNGIGVSDGCDDVALGLSRWNIDTENASDGMADAMEKG